jgi:hypothetical protein
MLVSDCQLQYKSGYLNYEKHCPFQVIYEVVHKKLMIHNVNCEIED